MGRRASLACALVVGFAGSSAAAPPGIDAKTRDAIKLADATAVVELQKIDIDCSGIGWVHYTFRVVRVARGKSMKSVRMKSGVHSADAIVDPRKVGQLFVAAIRPAVVPASKQHCVELPAADGWVDEIIRVESVDAGVALLKR